MFQWLAKQWRQLVGGAGDHDEPALSGAEVMAQMKAERARPADPGRWGEQLATLHGRVFSGMDRARLWRRARRRYPGDVVELELITSPDTHDLAALDDILRDLQR